MDNTSTTILEYFETQDDYPIRKTDLEYEQEINQLFEEQRWEIAKQLIDDQLSESIRANMEFINLYEKPDAL